MKNISYFMLICLTGCLFSCQSTPKDIAYFQNLEQYLKEHPTVQSNVETTIKSNDQLLITVSAPTLNQESVAQFNLPVTSFLDAGETSVTSTGSLQTYIVDPEGYINYPVLGRLKIVGKTKLEATNYLTNLISDYVADPIVNLQIVSFRVTVLGEVNSPGMKTTRNERLTILEALGLSSDLTIFGNRKNVLIIRENNGIKEFGRIDLTKSDIFSSPYYYLQQNDVIVVESNDTRKKNSKFGSAENYQLAIYSTVMGTISMVTTLILAFTTK
jgi:polysaccharide export outer membrane protein